ncbi:MAG: beta-ketoacyl-ACP synthase II [Chloroflexi bacterium]|nr:beta-ketoacyl-ACP synthase II [Chloroflexota bacterium]MBU1746807.1 beta-ketoacyl-ACP synthase II [Chloroflexota bacterium]MBU1877905.1 beta-ketoacyl-ACP synthase II [Chloroflexota bacterium]
MAPRQRIVITGLGAVTPLGLDVPTTWEGLVAGRSGVAAVTDFDVSDLPVQIAAQLKGFDPQHYVDYREARRLPRFTTLAIAATQEAIADAGLDLEKEDRNRMGLEIGSAVGGIDILVDQAQVFLEKGPRRVNPVVIPYFIINAAPCQLALMLDLHGPCSAPVSACATGINAIGESFHRLLLGQADVMVAGGTEAAISRLGLAVFGGIRALTPNHNHEPEQACRPFDATRSGTVIAEGAAVVVLETLEHAQRRGARIYAEVTGYGFSADGYHIAAPDPSGQGGAIAFRQAVAEAGLQPEDVPLIYAHGTGTPLNDTSETNAIKIAFGEHAYHLAVSSNKSMLGHMLGGAGSISVINAVLTLQHDLITPTINLNQPDPECDLDYVPWQPRQAHLDVVMANCSGFGGQNASLVVQRYQE